MKPGFFIFRFPKTFAPAYSRSAICRGRRPRRPTEFNDLLTSTNCRGELCSPKETVSKGLSKTPFPPGYHVPQLKILPLPIGQRVPNGDVLFPLPFIQRRPDARGGNIQPETPPVRREPYELHLRQHLRRRPVIHVIPDHVPSPFLKFNRGICAGGETPRPIRRGVSILIQPPGGEINSPV